MVVLQPQHAAVQLGAGGDDGQAQARAAGAARRVQAHEPLLHPAALVLRYAAAGVGHHDVHGVLALLHRHPHHSALARVLGGVVQQVADRLAQQRLVAMGDHRMWRGVDDQLLLRVLDHGREEVGQLLDQSRHVDPHHHLA